MVLVFDRRSKFLSLVTLLQDLAVICIAFGAAYLLRHPADPLSSFSTRGCRKFIPSRITFRCCWRCWRSGPLTGYFGTFYRDLELSNPVRIGANLLYQSLVVLVLAYAGLYLLKRTDISRTFVMAVGGVMFVALLAGRAISYSGVYWMRERLNRYHYCIVVGSGSRAREVATLIEESRGQRTAAGGFHRSGLRTAPPTQQRHRKLRSLPAVFGGAHPAEPGDRRGHLRRQHARAGATGAGDSALRQPGDQGAHAA